MKKYLVFLLGMMFFISTTQAVLAGEYDGTSVKAPADDDVRATIQEYINAVSKASGTFNINDPASKKTLNLSFVKIHKKVLKTGDNYYACADFKDINTREKYDLDLDVADNNGVLSVVELRIHKVGGKARYDYDDNNNRIAIKGVNSDLGGLAMPRMKTKK